MASEILRGWRLVALSLECFQGGFSHRHIHLNAAAVIKNCQVTFAGPRSLVLRALLHLTASWFLDHSIPSCLGAHNGQVQ